MRRSEHTTDAVESAARLSTTQLALTWMGFPFILAISMTGSVLVLTAGLQNAILATIVGSLALFGYVGLLGEWGFRSGKSFAQIGHEVYGARGYRVISGLLSLLVLGWFAINTAMPAEILATTYHIPYPTTAVILGLFYVAVAAAGILGLSRLSQWAVPLYAALLAYAIGHLTLATPASDHPFTLPTPVMGFWPALSAVLASFADSGTLAPDFNRWARTRRGSWIGTAFGFPLGFGLAMGLGELFTVLLATSHASYLKPFQNSNPVGFLLAFGGAQAAFAVIVAIINQGSNAAHCLYNSAVGAANLLTSRYRLTTVLLGLIGILLAATGVWRYLLDWLQLIGFAVPPIGGALIARYRRVYPSENRGGIEDLRARAPWLGTAAGWLVGLGLLITGAQDVLPLALISFGTGFLTTHFLDEAAPRKHSWALSDPPDGARSTRRP